MVYLYYSYFDHQWSAEDAQKATSLLPETEKIKIAKFIRWQDQQSGVLGKLLLKYGLKRLVNNASIDRIAHNKYGKPYLSEGPYFNISHSGNYVMCILSEDQEVGIDIEEIKKINVPDFESVFTQKEWKILVDVLYHPKTFYDLWTRKEAVIKALGLGLSIPLTKVEVIHNPVYCEGNNWVLEPIEVDPNYKCYFAASQSTPFNIKKVDLSQLISDCKEEIW